MGLPKDFHKLDLYGILDVHENADIKEVTKSYRKKALRCHPDKNPDNPKAVEEFHKLSLALEILTDVTARAAYDKVIQSKKAVHKRHRELDSKRKKFKEDLEARERAGNEERTRDVDAQTQLQREIERLRREGSWLVEEQQRLVVEEMQREAVSRTEPRVCADVVTPKVKVSWNGKTGSNGGYTEESLRETFSRYGHVLNVMMSTKKGRALIEFNKLNIMNVTSEKGKSENELTVKWLEGQSDEDTTHTSDTSSQSNTDIPPQTNVGHNNLTTERDFETLVMRKLRQAEERKTLIEEMAKRDADT